VASGYYHDEYGTTRQGSGPVKQTCVKLLGLARKRCCGKENLKAIFCVDLK